MYHRHLGGDASIVSIWHREALGNANIVRFWAILQS
jgi:hypothetical protein